ncbi:hypothetical protein ETD83_14760 [Actinomadura soli]|uniref:Uncharacterized protein n=1 Tax=Actinomadura soli TaxID=2508997 RepID=A0A5C4JCC9_9ACTN|nr:DUF5519 family protein [Actinomadura soli]TMR01257.1 hypothetical protein ETD83_14760 [Actinomadura soli]
MTELTRWPGLRPCVAECGNGPALALGSLQIVHLVAAHEVELRLGAPAVRRLSPALKDSGRLLALSMAEPDAHRRAQANEPGIQAEGSPEDEGWVRIRMDGDSDVTAILALASVAIAANAPGTASRSHSACACPRARRLRILSATAPRPGVSAPAVARSGPVLAKTGKPDPPLGVNGRGKNPYMDVAAREKAAMGEVTARLLQTYGPQHSTQEVTETVSAVHHRFDGRPIRAFVPILVERYVRQRLSE